MAVSKSQYKNIIIIYLFSAIDDYDSKLSGACRVCV